jgi:hypothetical protein
MEQRRTKNKINIKRGFLINFLSYSYYRLFVQNTIACTDVAHIILFNLTCIKGTRNLKCKCDFLAM